MEIPALMGLKSQWGMEGGFQITDKGNEIHRLDGKEQRMLIKKSTLPAGFIQF